MRIPLDKDEKARALLASWLRQCSGGTPPVEVPMTPALEKFADKETAQKIWSELLAGRSKRE